MSADYPVYEEWRAVRFTPRKLRRERYIWISKRLMTHRDPLTGVISTVVVPGKGETYRKG